MSIFSHLSQFFHRLEMRRKGSPMRVNLSPSVLVGLRIQQAIKEALVRRSGDIVGSVMAGSRGASTITKEEYLAEFSGPEYWDELAESEAELFHVYSSLIRKIEFTDDGPVVYTRWD